MTAPEKEEREGLSVGRLLCASGETVEWTLYVGDSPVAHIYGRFSRAEATKRLLAKAAGGPDPRYEARAKIEAAQCVANDPRANEGFEAMRRAALASLDEGNTDGK